MSRDSFDPSPEKIDIILIDQAFLFRAQPRILSCEACNPDAEIPFDWILDQLTGRSGSTTDYVLQLPATCLQCGGEICEKTLVDDATRLDDSPLLDRTTELGRVLFSQDKDLLKVATECQRTGITFAGVIYAHQLRVTIGRSPEDLELIAKATDLEEWGNRVEFLPL